MKVYSGCSGFYYHDWIGKFYPEDLPVSEWLSYYAQRFNTVEINSSFYHLPSRKTLKHWYEVTPRSFRITLKGSRYVTHIRKLVNVKEALKKFYTLADSLEDKLGCILWQLPGNLHYDQQRLITFCKMLGSNYKNVIEFRHPSWYVDDVYQTLHQHNVTFSAVSAPGLPEVVKKTTNTVYIRFHGKKSWYDYLYKNKELDSWAARIKNQRPKLVYAYFNNDFHANAPTNCLSFERTMRDEMKIATTTSITT
jgi:uncharacterized protein YecE (DUF72 family)